MGFSLSLQNFACHVHQRGTVFYFRLTIPADLRHIFSKTEFKFSLGRIPLREARVRSNAIGSTIKLFFEQIREGNMSHLTEKEIAGIVEQEVRELLNVDWRKRVTEKKPVRKSYSEPQENIENYNLRGFEWHFPPPQRELVEAKETYEWPLQVQIAADDIIHKRGLDMKQGTWEYNLLCFSLCHAMEWFYDVSNQRDIGRFNSIMEQASPFGDIFPEFREKNINILQQDTDKSTQQSQSQINTGTAQPTPQQPDHARQQKSHTLSEVVEAYLDEGGWTEKTYNEYEASLALLQRVIGDMPANQIKKPTIRNYKDMLRKLPPNINKNKDYKDKSIKEIIDLGHKPISIDTVNKESGPKGAGFGSP